MSGQSSRPNKPVVANTLRWTTKLESTQGDVLTFKTKFQSWSNWQNPVPDFVQCQAFVIRKTLRRRTPAVQTDVQSMQLALKFPEQLQLESWKSGSSEFVTQYNAHIQDISKLTKLPTPNAWALLTQLPEAQLALLSQNTATCNANDWASPSRPKAETAAKCFKLREKQVLAHQAHYTYLRKSIVATKGQGKTADEIREKILCHAFTWFGHNSGTDAQNILFSGSRERTSSRQD